MKRRVIAAKQLFSLFGEKQIGIPNETLSIQSVDGLMFLAFIIVTHIKISDLREMIPKPVHSERW